jgi:hypothetical protein
MAHPVRACCRANGIFEDSLDLSSSEPERVGRCPRCTSYHLAKGAPQGIGTPDAHLPIPGKIITHVLGDLSHSYSTQSSATANAVSKREAPPDRIGPPNPTLAGAITLSTELTAKRRHKSAPETIVDTCDSSKPSNRRYELASDKIPPTKRHKSASCKSVSGKSPPGGCRGDTGRGGMGEIDQIGKRGESIGQECTREQFVCKVFSGSYLWGTSTIRWGSTNLL